MLGSSRLGIVVAPRALELFGKEAEEPVGIAPHR